MDYQLLSDLELVSMYGNTSDKTAFSTLYDRYVIQLYRFIYSLCGNRELSEDIVSDTFFTLLNEVTHYNGTSKFFTFIASIAKHKLYNRFRKDSKLARQFIDEETELVDSYEMSDDSVGSENDPTMLIKLQNVMNTIPTQYREVLEFRYTQNLSIKEIGERLNKDSGTVRVLLHRSLKAATEIATELT